MQELGNFNALIMGWLLVWIGYTGYVLFLAFVWPDIRPKLGNKWKRHS